MDKLSARKKLVSFFYLIAKDQKWITLVELQHFEGFSNFKKPANFKGFALKILLIGKWHNSKNNFLGYCLAIYKVVNNRRCNFQREISEIEKVQFPTEH